jgi:hypothetical protein
MGQMPIASILSACGYASIFSFDYNLCRVALETVECDYRRLIVSFFSESTEFDVKLPAIVGLGALRLTSESPTSSHADKSRG